MAFANDLSGDTELLKIQISRMIQSDGFVYVSNTKILGVSGT